MKVTKQKLEQVFKQLFPTAEVVEEGADDTVSIDDIISEIDANREPILKDRLKDSMHKELRGKWAGSVNRQLMRQTGISESELSKAQDVESAVKMAVAHAVSKVEGASGDIQKTIDELTANHNNSLEALKSEYEAKLSESDKKFQQREIFEFVADQLGSVSIKDGVDKKMLAKIILSELENSNDISYSYDDGKVVVNKKGTQSPALNGNGNALFSWKEAIENIVSPLGVITKDTGGVNPMEALGQQKGLQDSLPHQGLNNNPANNLTDFNKAVAAAHFKS